MSVNDKPRDWGDFAAEIVALEAESLASLEAEPDFNNVVSKAHFFQAVRNWDAVERSLARAVDLADGNGTKLYRLGVFIYTITLMEGKTKAAIRLVDEFRDNMREKCGLDYLRFIEDKMEKNGMKIE